METILIDIDDTLISTLPAWIDRLNRRYGTYVKPEDIDQWNIEPFFPGLSPDKIYRPLHEEELWQNVQPKPGAVEYLSKLVLQYKVYLCTCASPAQTALKIKYPLRKYFPFIGSEQIIVTSVKQMIRGDVLVDDAIQNLRGGDYDKLLMTSPHNSKFDANANGIIRVNSWEEIYTTIRSRHERN